MRFCQSFMTELCKYIGNLDETSMRMADYYDKQFRMHSKISNATLYPKILSFVIVVVVIFMLGYILPQFQDLFAQMEELPLPTKILFAMSDGVKEHWLMLLILLAILVPLLMFVAHIPKVRLQLDQMKLHTPIFGKLLKIVYTARFARTISSLYASGIPIVQALQIARKTIGNTYIDSQFDEAVAKIRTGGNLSDALDAIDGFTKKLTSAVRVGEETGSLDSMLNSIADSMEFESNLAIDKMVATLEPVLIVLFRQLPAPPLRVRLRLCQRAGDRGRPADGPHDGRDRGREGPTLLLRSHVINENQSFLK